MAPEGYVPLPPYFKPGTIVTFPSSALEVEEIDGRKFYFVKADLCRAGIQE